MFLFSMFDSCLPHLNVMIEKLRLNFIKKYVSFLILYIILLSLDFNLEAIWA